MLIFSKCLPRYDTIIRPGTINAHLQIGRGFCEIVLDPTKLFGQIRDLVDRYSATVSRDGCVMLCPRSCCPVLANIELLIDNVTCADVEIYPPIIPDLFVGNPTYTRIDTFPLLSSRQVHHW